MGCRLGKKEVAARLAASERQGKAVDLYIQGWSFRKIAVELGYGGPSSVKKAIDGAIAKAPARALGELRAELEERSRSILAEFMPVVFDRKVPLEGRLAAVDRIIKIDHELRQMNGVDPPKQHRIGGARGAPPVAVVDYGELAEMSDEQLSEAREALTKIAEVVTRANPDADDRSGTGDEAAEEGSDE